ncbi:MAG: hypothetical protein FD130_921 [Halothiobacillaceae bacterium]|nr:MAG: hypothetical protein FD130_921 [Halothiobacillaceae bacterium]
MKENVLDVLMYLFEHYIESEVSVGYPEQESIRTELVDAGFTHTEVDKAFVWLEGLASLKAHTGPGLITQKRSIRIFHSEEVKKISVECRGFLLFLDQLGVLDLANRELVIDRVMALEGDELDLRELKWIILMVLFNQPGQEAAFAWIEDQVFDEFAPVAH